MFVMLLTVVLFLTSANISFKIKIMPCFSIMERCGIGVSECSPVEVKDYVHWINLTTSYGQRMPKSGYKEVVPAFASAIAREMCRFVHMKGIYCTSSKALAKENDAIRVYTDIKKKYYRVDSLECCDSIVYLFSEWGMVFAHFLHDCLPQILFIPQDILDKSKVMISYNITLAKPYLQVLGIPEEKLIYDETWYYAKDFYMCYSVEPHNGFNMYSFLRIGEIMRDKLNTTHIVSSRYIFINRLKNESRNIGNIKEFKDAANQVYCSMKWEEELLDYKNLTHIAHVFASIKILVTPSGSHVNYALFMKKNYTTGICLIKSDLIDTPNYIVGYCNQIWMNGFIHSWYHHDKTSSHDCDIGRGIQTLGSLIHAVTKHSWDSEAINNTNEVFDFQTISKVAHSDPTGVYRLLWKNDLVLYVKDFDGFS